MKTKEEIEQLADEWLAETPIKEWGGVENGFIIGYQKCQEDGKDKKYTEEDIIKAITYGQTTKQIDYHKDFINSLNKQD
jgi:hypothetical protein